MKDTERPDSTHRRFKERYLLKQNKSSEFLSSYKTTLKQQLNGQKLWKKRDEKRNHLSGFGWASLVCCCYYCCFCCFSKPNLADFVSTNKQRSTEPFMCLGLVLDASSHPCFRFLLLHKKTIKQPCVSAKSGDSTAPETTTSTTGTTSQTSTEGAAATTSTATTSSSTTTTVLNW